MSRFFHDTPAVWRLIRSTRPTWAHTVLLCCLAAPQAYADSGSAHERTPQEFDRGACYQLVRHEGRMIAWARWEERFSLEKTRAAQFAEDTPAWVVDLIQGWIADAYDWRATDEQIWQWAEELGNTENLPSAQRLTKHETIAIWLRRIARQCDSRLREASAQDSAVVRAGE
jgi:hypothetical protein